MSLMLEVGRHRKVIIIISSLSSYFKYRKDKMMKAAKDEPMQLIGFDSDTRSKLHIIQSLSSTNKLSI